MVSRLFYRNYVTTVKLLCICIYISSKDLFMFNQIIYRIIDKSGRVCLKSDYIISNRNLKDQDSGRPYIIDKRQLNGIQW